ncbi:MAG: response regulator transcription factor [Verrucomicrobia bacterium]|jgi:DNA-binding NarL/FixJ family response regulator|nr:response regulator transcription factor [Verrucomicrobiota bacterium]MDA7511055.1 response regulator transcription factor [Verrucomicrobiota bacterium]
MGQQEEREIRVCLVEDDSRVRDGLTMLIDGSPGYRVINGYPRGELALKSLPEDRADVVLMDIKMPGINGIECVRQLKRLLPDVNIIMLTTYEDEDLLFESLRAGAVSYLLKRTPPAKILEAIADVHHGYSSLTGKMARLLVQFFQNSKPEADGIEKLSEREREILDRVAKGLRNKEIGVALSVSENTIRSHLRNIYEKLQVASRAEAVAKYMEK